MRIFFKWLQISLVCTGLLIALISNASSEEKTISSSVTYTVAQAMDKNTRSSKDNQKTMGQLAARGKKSRPQSSVPEIRDIGIPVRAFFPNSGRIIPGRNRDGDRCLYSLLGQRADNFLLVQIDPETGSARKFLCDLPSKDANYPTQTLMTRSGCLYIGVAYAGHLYRFDPDKDIMEDLGMINPKGGASFTCGLLEDDNGIIWIGSYGGTDLTSFDPATDKFTNHGSMDDVDKYNYISLNNDGNIICSIRMSRPHFVVFDPKTGKKNKVGPITEAGGKDTLGLFHGNDGYTYVTSNLGNFRIDGINGIPVDKLPDPEQKPAPKVSNEPKYAFADSRNRTYRVLEVTKSDGEVKTFELDYQSSGTDIFYLHPGPDGNLYGASILPEHLFRFNPKTGELIDFGICSESTGEAYSMATLDEKIYISSYGGGNVSVYDPTLPYHYGKETGDNPLELGRIDVLSCRPRSTLAGPLGRIWVASVPNYGCWGSILSYYDPHTRIRKTYEGIAGDASCYTLAYLKDQDLIAVGTTRAGGTGTKRKVEQSEILLWDYRNEKKVWNGTVKHEVHSFNALLYGPDGRLYGTILAEGSLGVDTQPVDWEYSADKLIDGKLTPEFLFVFDPDSREFTDFISLPQGRPLDLGLQIGPDGKIYGFTTSCIYRLDPKTLKIEVIKKEKNAFSRTGPIIGNDIYFATNYMLRSLKIF